MARMRPIPASRNIRKENNFKDAINTATSPFYISDNTITDGYGLDFGQFPSLAVRSGRVAYGETGAATTQLMANLGNSKLVRVVGTTLQYDNAGTWTNIATGVAAGLWDYTNFEVSGLPAIIIVNPGSVPKYWDGTTYGSLGGTPPQASYVTNDNIRVWMAKDDQIYFSAFEDSGDWSSPENSGIVQYYTERGGNITAMKNFYGDKYVWKNDSMAVIQGTNYFNFRLMDISNSVGCVSFRTLKEVDGILFFLGQTDLYQFSGGIPVPIGNSIRRFLDSINPTAITNAVAWTDEHAYYLCIPTGSNTEPDTCLVYDTRYKEWLPYSVTLGGLRYGVKFNNIPYVGDSSGLTFKMNTGTTDNGTDIPWMIQSKPFDDGGKELEKELYEMYMQGYFPSGSTLTVSVSPFDQGSEWHTINYDPIATASESQNKNLIVPLDTVPLCYFYRYRLNGTGPVTVTAVQRYSRLQPAQY